METIYNSPQPKYALLTYAEYMKLNHDLSIAKGWQLGQDTERSYSMQPQSAKINITYDGQGNETGYDLVKAVLISSKVQQDYADVISGITLYDRGEVNFVDTTEEPDIEDAIEPEVVDWTLNHCEKQGVDTEKLRTYIAGQDASNYPVIPNEGEWCEARVYKYGNDKAKCIQPHFRTHRTPEEEPALWTVIKTVSNYDDVEDWNGSNWLAYQTVGYLVKYNNKIWASRLPISHTWIAPALEGNGAISWEFVADV